MTLLSFLPLLALYLLFMQFHWRGDLNDLCFDSFYFGSEGRSLVLGWGQTQPHFLWFLVFELNHTRASAVITQNLRSLLLKI